MFILLWFLLAWFVWRVCAPSYFFSFLVNDLHLILPLLIHVKNQFCFATIVYIFIVIITLILFFATLPVNGAEFSKWIRAAWSTPTHWLLWVSRRVSIIIIIICFLFFFFVAVSYFLVTTVEVLTPFFIFIIWNHLIMMPTRQGVFAFLADVIWAIARQNLLCKIC